jgi:2-polyprenyl-3-methyl-5-hydroxy-6-metoxy-1,4-benzoquinol methylase
VLGRSRKVKHSVATEPIEPEFIDVRDLIDKYTVEELIDGAENYFARIPVWDGQLSKPFSIQEAPELLATFSTLLSGLQLHYVGQTVLDFGVGAGWTSWIMSQMGCKVISADVSATALKMAEERYRRHPLVGERTIAEFRLFDGHELDLPNDSVDRVAINDAFHHVPNPEEVLREFFRVLRPGGICVMSEGGPYHSRSPQAQAEMRQFAVIERDIILTDVLDQAQRAGFDSVEVGIYSAFPLFVDASNFDSCIANGSPVPGEMIRTYLANRRLLRLRKAGTETLDSRSRTGLAGSLIVVARPPEIEVSATNTGSSVWLPPGQIGSVNVGAHLYDSSGELLDFDLMRIPLEAGGQSVSPHETAIGKGQIPELPPGVYVIEFDLVAEGVTWFAELGTRTTRISYQYPYPK